MFRVLPRCPSGKRVYHPFGCPEQPRRTMVGKHTRMRRHTVPRLDQNTRCQSSVRAGFEVTHFVSDDDGIEQ